MLRGPIVLRSDIRETHPSTVNELNISWQQR
jgi:hypothetical protein